MSGKTEPRAGRTEGGLRPWHLLLVGALAAASAGAVVTGGTGPAHTVLVVVSIGSAALVAMGVFRTLSPLVGSDAGEQAEMLAGRTRAALEREKLLVLRSIKEIEFDRAMKKISETDFQEMSSRLRQRAAGLMRQLEGESGYRALIERDLAGLIGKRVPPPTATTAASRPRPASCPVCQTSNDSDARFCKECGTPLTGGTS